MTTTAPARGADLAVELRGSRRRHTREQMVKYLFFGAALFSVFISAGILYSLFSEAWTFISQVDWIEQVWNADQWAPRFGQYDIRTLFVGSLIVTGVAMLVAIPVGLGAAIYLSEYANPQVRKVLKPTIEILAGIPSVVLGFFALQFIAPEIVQRFFASAGLFSLASAGLGVGLLSIPLMAAVSEDALRAVPGSLREASSGLGARKVTTVTRVVLPAAVSGIVAAAIITISRAIGETMVVFIAAGGAGNQTSFTWNPLDPGSTMTAAMAAQASGTDAVVGEGLTFQSLFFVGLVLFFITLFLNLMADRFVRRVREAY